MTETIQVVTKLPMIFDSVLEILDLYVDLVHICVVGLTVSMTCLSVLGKVIMKYFFWNI